MAQANPLWGVPRIHGELLKLGLDVSQTTVTKYLRRRPRPPSPTWRAFLQTHLSQMVSIDFFTVSTATFRVRSSWVVFVHERRRILHVNLTAHPTSDFAGTVAAIGIDKANRLHTQLDSQAGHHRFINVVASPASLKALPWAVRLN
jgi:hypothetical protein